MKIGQVAKEYGVSVDTINYYVSYGLLVPPRKGGQRFFDERTRRDLELVLGLRELDFSLREIHEILSLYRVSSLAGANDLNDLRHLYEQKRNDRARERERLLNVVKALDEKIAELLERSKKNAPRSGLPLSVLPSLCCPVCGGELEIKNARMNQRYMQSGSLSCGCGYGAEIDDGILLTPNKNKDVYDKPDVNRDMYKNLPPHLISLFQSSYNWMTRRLEITGTAGKTVLETHVNAWFFMHNHQQYLSPDGRYIVVDKYPETLSMYKKLIEAQGFSRDILYIADASVDWPLKKGIVDVNVDFFATNEHYFYWKTFLLSDIKKYFKNDAAALGTYFYFENGKKSMETLLREYPTCSPLNFNLEKFLRKTQEAGFAITERGEAGCTTSSGNNIGFSFHQEGEKMYLLPYLAKRIN